MRPINELWNILGRPLIKGRTYITDPSKAPKNVKVQQGKRGGFFYDTSAGAATTKPKETWQVPVDDFVMDYIRSKHAEIYSNHDTVEANRIKLNYRMEAATIHAKAMKEAVASGKKIPKKTLKDYPQYAEAAEKKKPKTPRKKRLSTGGFASLMNESPKFESRRSFIKAVNHAWNEGDLIEVGSERGVAFGGMVLTTDVMDKLVTGSKFNNLLRYGGK
jgi:vacuolar-type H+-ATPase subunit E/Vma4